MFATSLPIKKRVIGMNHSWTGIAMNGLAAAYLRTGRVDDARPILVELLDFLQPQIESASPSANSLNIAAWVLTRGVEGIDDPERAIQLARRACEIVEANQGGRLGNYHATLARAFFMRVELEEAVEAQRRAVEFMPNSVGLAETLAQYESALESGRNQAVGASDN